MSLEELYQEFVVKEVVSNVKKGKIKNPFTVDNSISQEQRFDLLERGRTDFNENSLNVSPQILVLLYCFYYMQMHIESTKEFYTRILDKLDLINTDITFYDFGCGPVTSPISFHYILNAKTNGIKTKIEYNCIDRSPYMLDKAYELSKSGFFSELEHFLFHRTFKVSEKNDETIIINFSYVISNSEVKIDYISELIQTTKTHSKNSKIILIYQDPVNKTFNNKWDKLKEELSGFKLIKSLSGEFNFNYKDSLGSWNYENKKMSAIGEVLISSPS